MSETLRGLDQYLTTDPRDRDHPNWDAPAHYRCRDCAWSGRALASAEHYRATGHTLTVMGLVVPFGEVSRG